MLKKLKKLYIQEQFNPKILGLFINPFYFARKGLYQDVSILILHLKGKLLDVGCGTRPYENMCNVDEYIGLEVDDEGNRNHSFADIFYDGKNDDTRADVDKVRKYIDNIDGFKKVTIIKRKINWGLANSIIDGVTNIINKYKKVIVLEDDLVTSIHFLRFMNESLDMYEKDNQVASIHGYIYPIEGLPDTFFIKGADCWGWATWKRAWDIFEPNGQKILDELKSRRLEKEADFNNSYGFTQMLKDQIKGKNNSWAVRWHMSAFLRDMLTLYPGKSYVQNIGNDDSGTHCGVSDIFRVELSMRNNSNRLELVENSDNRKKMEIFFHSINGTFIQKLKTRIKRFIK